MMRSGRADLTVCDSLENGVILLYNRIRTKANAEFDILLEEADIDGILKDGESTYSPAVVSLVEKLAQGFVNDLANSLRERMLDLMSGMVVFVGGGAILLRRHIEASRKVGNPLFVEDISANAKGYEFLYKAETIGR
jgi:plasmid segregation protein ParM